MDDREELDNLDFDSNLIVEDINTGNQVPPEYANDPDLFYSIQASLKVKFRFENMLTFVEGLSWHTK